MDDFHIVTMLDGFDDLGEVVEVLLSIDRSLHSVSFFEVVIESTGFT